MPHPFDAASKHMLQAHPLDWLALGGLPAGTSFEIIDADLSSVSMAADKLIRVNAASPYAAHLEFQASLDRNLDGRVLVYNVLARHRLLMPVRSVVFLLRPQALGAGVTGTVADSADAGHRLEFAYRLVRVWEIPVQSLLQAGLGTLPLAPISAVEEPELPGVIAAMQDRFERDAPAGEAKELWTSTRVLMGLRWSPDLVGRLLHGVQGMKESATYQEMVREGRQEGMEQGLEIGIERGLQRGLERGLEQGLERGLEQGRTTEARSLLVRHGTKRFGVPTPTISGRLEAISDVHQLEDLLDHILDGSAKTWPELLESQPS